MSKKANREKAKRWYDNHKHDPELIEKRKKYMNEYNKRTKEKRKEYYKKYYLRKKQKRCRTNENEN